MRTYDMSFGVNEPLVTFNKKTDVEAKIHAMSLDAEYCVRVTNGGRSKYTVLDYGWNAISA